jgi:hypothetical protein
MKTIYRTPAEEMEGGFTPVPNKTVVFNRKLSATARMLLITMLACKFDTVTTKRLMMNYSGINERPLNRALKELIQQGYCRKVPVQRTKDIRYSNVYHFADTNLWGLQNAVPHSADPQSGDAKTQCLFKKDSSTSISSNTALLQGEQPERAELHPSPKGDESSAIAETSTLTNEPFFIGRLEMGMDTSRPVTVLLEESLARYREWRYAMLENTGYSYTDPKDAIEKKTLAALCKRDLKNNPEKIMYLVYGLNALTLFLQERGHDMFLYKHEGQKFSFKKTIQQHFPEEYRCIAELNFAGNLRKAAPQLRKDVMAGVYNEVAYGKLDPYRENKPKALKKVVDDIQMPPELLELDN